MFHLLLTLAFGASFEEDLQATVSSLRADNPADAELVDQIQATPTRAGFLRLVGPGLETDSATPLLAQRLIEGQDPAEVRQAIARALAGDCEEHFELVAGLYAVEEDVEVRGILLSGMTRADERALPILAEALNDESARIRLEAARVLGHHEAGAELLLPGLEDGDDRVRAMAVRKLGYLGYAPAFDQVQSRLGDDSALVRLQAVNALERLDPNRAAQVVTPLVEDRDMAVRRAAERVTR